MSDRRVFSSTRIESKPGSIIGEIARQFVHEFQVPIVREKLPREVSLHAFDFGTAVPFSELMRQTNGEVVTLLRDLNLCFLDSGPTNPRPSLRRDGCPNYAIINNGSGPRVVRVKRMDRSANYQIDMTPIIVGGGKANKCEPRCRVFSRVPLVGWTPSEQK